jgi:hypothetical protein
MAKEGPAMEFRTMKQGGEYGLATLPEQLRL